MEPIHFTFKTNPLFVYIFLCIRHPNSEDVIDVPLVSVELGVFWKELLFVYCKEEVGIVACWWGPHGSFCVLDPEDVAELKNVVFHYDVKNFHESVNGDVWELVFSLDDKLCYFTECGSGADVCIH